MTTHRDIRDRYQRIRRDLMGTHASVSDEIERATGEERHLLITARMRINNAYAVLLDAENAARVEAARGVQP